MTPASKHLVEMFEEMKRQNQEQLERVERLPTFRMTEVTQNGQRDVTDEYKRRLLDSIDQWQQAIDYLKRQP